MDERADSTDQESISGPVPQDSSGMALVHCAACGWAMVRVVASVPPAELAPVYCSVCFDRELG